MPIVLYQIPSCGPCRAVKMAAQHLGIKLDYIHVSLYAGDHMKPEFLAKNPLHTVPTIDDDGFYLWESHVIMTYLVNKYAPGNPIYPKDPQQRAVVDRLLYFDTSLNSTQLEYLFPLVIEGLPPDPEKEENMKKALDHLEQFLEKTTYAAGNHLTLADFSVVSTISFIDEVGNYSLASYPKTSAYLQRMKKEIPNYKEINDVPLGKLREHSKSRKTQK